MFRELTKTFCSGNIIKNVLDCLEPKDRMESAKPELEDKSAELETRLKDRILEIIPKHKKDPVQMKAALEQNIKNELEEAEVSVQISSERLKDAIEKLLKVLFVKEEGEPKPVITA